MELYQYIIIFRRWLWLILIATIVAGGMAFISSNMRTPRYQAEVTVLIGSFIDTPNPEYNEIRTGGELAQVYVELIKTHDVLQGTIDALNLPLSVGDLRDNIRVSASTTTAMLRISMTHEDPVIAADVANGIADQLILNSPSNLTAEQESQINFIQEQVDALSLQVQTGRDQLSALDAQIAAATVQDEADRLTERYNEIVTQVNQATATIAQFSDTIATLRQGTNSVEIVDRARIPTSPIGTSALRTTILGAMVGAALGVGVVLMIEYLIDTIRTTEDVTQILELPVLAPVPVFGRGGSYHDQLITQPNLHPAVGESYRRLRTNLLFSNSGGNKKAYVVTSPSPSEGKSVTAANLAVAMAMAGVRVLLVDADLRRPTLHTIFQLPNDKGLTTLLLADEIAAQEIDQSSGDNGAPVKVDFKECLQNTHVPKLRVITSGRPPANPGELLGSLLLKRWVKTFLSSSNVDIVIFDTPPCLAVADAPTVAVSAHADVILVIQAGSTRRSHALHAKHQFEGIQREIRGVVLNRFNPRDEYYSYNYYYEYYTRDSRRPRSAVSAKRPDKEETPQA